MSDFIELLSAEQIPHVANIALLISIVIGGVLAAFLWKFNREINPLNAELKEAITFVSKVRQQLNREQYGDLVGFFSKIPLPPLERVR